MEGTSRNLELRAVEGDQDALTRLIELHDATLRGKLGGKIPKRWQAVLSLDDLMQETYTDAFLDIADFTPRGDGAFEAWLITVAKHNVISAVRSLEAEKRGGKRQRVETARQDESFLALYQLLGCTTTTPSRHAARSEAKEALGKALDRLPNDYRTVIKMYDLEGRPIDDVAGAMDRSPGAVFMLRARAHGALRRLLGSPLQYFSDFA